MAIGPSQGYEGSNAVSADLADFRAVGPATLPSAPSARDITLSRDSAPVKVFATLGLGWVLLIAYVFLRWLTSSYLGPTAPGPDRPPDYVLYSIRSFEVLMSTLALWLVWECVVKPVRQTGAVGTDGLLLITWFSLWFHDTFIDWTVHVFSYNAYALNVGNWTQEVPGWLSPRSNLVPEPLLALGLSYIGQCTMGCWCTMAAMQKCKERWPRMGKASMVGVALATGMMLDWASEQTMVSFQLMAYLSTVPALTVFPGRLYQFPLYEAFFFGGVVGFTGVVMYFKDDKGFTWAERGVERLRITRARGMKTLVRWLSLMGLFHTAMFLFYSLPMQLFAINGGAFPDHVPSYLRNGICGPETPYPCAGPGVPIPRRTEAPARSYEPTTRAR
jgi:hypothetical protein